MKKWQSRAEILQEYMDEQTKREQISLKANSKGLVANISYASTILISLAYRQAIQKEGGGRAEDKPTFSQFSKK